MDFVKRQVVAPTAMKLPPQTLVEVDAVIDEIVKARLIARLSYPQHAFHTDPVASTIQQVESHNSPVSAGTS
jgi:hypothetical protein